MALVIEEGSVVAGADSFATVVELRAFAAKRGASVPAAGGAGDSACEVLLVKGMDYIRAQDQRLKGELVQWDQPCPFPRFGVTINGYELPSNTIPADIKSAQMQAAIEAQTVDLLPTATVGQVGAVIEKTIDVITTKYAEPQTQRTAPVLARVNGYLAKFFDSGSNQIKLVRG